MKKKNIIMMLVLYMLVPHHQHPYLYFHFIHHPIYQLLYFSSRNFILSSNNKKKNHHYRWYSIGTCSCTQLKLKRTHRGYPFMISSIYLSIIILFILIMISTYHPIYISINRIYPSVVILSLT